LKRLWSTLALALGMLALLGVVSYRSLLQMTADADRVMCGTRFAACSPGGEAGPGRGRP
jgi:hypothetical protein